MSSLMEKLAAQAEPKQTKKDKKKAAPETAPQSTTFEITEAEIQSNPVYALSTSDKPFTKKLEELAALKQYDPELTPEENAEKLEEWSKTLIYYENTIMEAALRGKEFTHDDAMSLVDDFQRELRDNVMAFQGEIEPFVAALKVLGKAREAGIATHDFINGVQEIKDAVTALNADKEAKQGEIDAKTAEIEPVQGDAATVARQIEEHNATITQARDAKDAAQAVLDEQELKWRWSKDKDAIQKAERTIARSDATIQSSESSLQALGNSAEVTAQTLARLEEERTALEGELASIAQSIDTKEAELNEDEDTAAISKLIDITGKGFKENRDKITSLVDSIATEGVRKAENTLDRIQAGQTEIEGARGTVTNITDFNSVLTEASKQAREADNSFVEAQRKIMADIVEQKGEDEAKRDPDYLKAKKHLEHVVDHERESGKLTDRSATIGQLGVEGNKNFTATLEGLDQAEAQTGRLRTTVTVKTSMNAMAVLKAVEFATVSEGLDMTGNLIDEMDKTSMTAVNEIFNMAVANADKTNEREARLLREAQEAIEGIDGFIGEIREREEQRIQTRAALQGATDEMSGLTDDLRSARGDVSRQTEVANDDEQTPAPTAAKKAPGGPAPS